MVPINIWDDYESDGTSKKQETFIYIETEEELIPLEDQKLYLEHLIKYMRTNCGDKLNNVTLNLEINDSRITWPTLNTPEYDAMHFKRWQINVVGLTHRTREGLLGDLNRGDMPFDIYSES